MPRPWARTCQNCLGPRQAQGTKPKIPKGDSCNLSWPTYAAFPKLKKWVHAHNVKVSGSVGQRPRPRLKPRPRFQLLLQLRLPQVPKPPQRLQCRGSIYQSEEEGPVWPWVFCLHGSGVLLCCLDKQTCDRKKKKVLPFRQGTRQRSHYCHSNSAPNTVVLARLIRHEIN